MRRSKFKNIINKSKELSKPTSAFDKFKNSLPEEVPVGYRLQAAWEAYGKPANYKEAVWLGLIQPIDENTIKWPSIGYNTETEEYEYLNEGRENDTIAKDIRVWDNDVIPFVQELKRGGYVRAFNEEKNCWTYSKNPLAETFDPEEEVIEQFEMGGKTNKNELEIKEKLLKEWPVLGNIKFHIVSDSTFTKDKTGKGSIEYFSPEEKEYMSYPNGYKHKNPYVGEASIVYNPSDNDYEDIKMDLLHALRVQDPQYRALVNQIDKIVLEGDDDLHRNAKLHYDEDYKKYGKEYAPFQIYVENEVDGLLRNLFYNGSPQMLEQKNYYPNKESLKKWNQHLLPYIQKIEKYLQGSPQAFKTGGQMNLIPEGALHARKNNLEGAGEDFTAKGIPVMTTDGKEQVAEIEHSEIILNKELTDFVEENYKKFKSDETSEKEKDELAIKVGKKLVKDILTNTDDRTNLIETVQEQM